MSELTDVLEEISNFPIDRRFLPQEKLDVENRVSTSLYPWRGQFSPGLVELLLTAYSREGSTVLDPFVGSGTTLFEASRRNLECYGVEINPAAIQLAGMSRFANLDHFSRERIFGKAEELLEDHVSPFLPASLFRPHANNADGRVPPEAISRMLEEASGEPLLHNLVTTSVMIAMGNRDRLEAEPLYAAFCKNSLAVSRLPLSYQPCRVLAGDARNLPLADQSVDLVLTSPPYINVFNYHQHYRKALELMGWRPLEVARSEVGSNRKHRSNRFITVVQYCMDLAQMFVELKRVLTPGGTAVFVIGRESRVRGVPFNNGVLLAATATHAARFCVHRWQERKFVSRYGENIYEDIVVLSPGKGETESPKERGRDVGVLTLEKALNTTNGDVQKDVKQAIEQGTRIEPSALFTVIPSGKAVS